MGYGVGVLLLAVGLILALAVDDVVGGVDMRLIGWILAGVGALAILLTAMTAMRRGAAGSVSTTTHPDGSQTTTQQRHDAGPPA